MLGEETREQLGVWTAEGCGFVVKVFVRTCSHVSTSFYELPLTENYYGFR